MTTQRHIESELLTVDEAAQELRLHPETVKRALRSGARPGVRLEGGPWRVHREDVAALRTRRDARTHRRRDVPADHLEPA